MSKTFKEVYLQRLSETNNFVWSEKYSTQPKASDKEWSQVFDLGDTVLVW
jgi:hypothetical protein